MHAIADEPPHEPEQESLLDRTREKVWRMLSGQAPGGAFGAPGAEPRWTRSAKEGIGTAYHTSCRLWFTISHGIINEIYYPHVDQPNTRDLQFLITDGETFCHEERRDLEHKVEYPEKGGLLSPATLAAMIAGLIIVAEFARQRGDETAAQFSLDYADWLSAHLEEWTVTTCGELVPDRPRHYLRITPSDCHAPHEMAQPDTAVLKIANGAGEKPARNVVGGEFLHLVRLGLRDPHDPIMVDSIAVLDAALKHDLPQGPCWQRYNHDRYGQHADGAAFDGDGIGGAWPLLTGERGHYELAAGRDALPFIKAMEGFSNAGGMLPEQIWFADELPGTHFKLGAPTGSAMPLCWTHAEYLTLVRSRADGVPFDRVVPAYQRYVESRASSALEMWTCAHQIPRIPAGKTLRVIAASAAVIQWSATDGSKGEVTATETAFGLCFADLPTTELASGSEIEFTLRGEEKQDAELHRVAID